MLKTFITASLISNTPMAVQASKRTEAECFKIMSIETKTPIVDITKMLMVCSNVFLDKPHDKLTAIEKVIKTTNLIECQTMSIAFKDFMKRCEAGE